MSLRDTDSLDEGIEGSRMQVPGLQAYEGQPGAYGQLPVEWKA